jgi:mannitol/fructose-specific phosphotransferase system IIA component (Ntr-type)
MVTDYLKVVGGLARILKANAVRESLLEARTVEEFVSSLHAAESQI